MRQTLGLVLVLACALTFAPGALAHETPVVVVRGLEVEDLDRLAERGAVGLVVPDAGPTTGRARAIAALERGAVRNSLRGGLPSGPRLIRVRVSRELPFGEAIVVGLPERDEQRNDRRYPIAVIGHGATGLLVSDSTRIPGLVSIADVAATALVRPDSLRASFVDDPAAELHALDRRIRANERVRVLTAALVAVAIGLLALVWARAAVLAFAAVLAVNLVLGAADVSGVPASAILVAAALLGGPALAALARSRLAAGVVLAGVMLAYAGALGADHLVVSLSPLGPSQNGRFYGISNLLETMLLVPALAGAALLWRRLGAIVALAVAALALVTIASGRLGADGGGAIVLAAGYAVLGAFLVPRGARGRAAVVATLFVIAALAADLAFGPSTHVTDTVRDGPGAVVSAAADRIELSWLRATSSWAVGIVVAASVAALAASVAALRRARAGEPRALPLAFAAAIAVSLLVNDSPREVAVGGLVGYLALAAYEGVLPRWATRLHVQFPGR